MFPLPFLAFGYVNSTLTQKYYLYYYYYFSWLTWDTHRSLLIPRFSTFGTPTSKLKSYNTPSISSVGALGGNDGTQHHKIWTWLRSSSLQFFWHFPGGLNPPIRFLFHGPRRLPSYLHSILATCFIIPHTTASFSRQLCVYLCVCV